MRYFIIQSYNRFNFNIIYFQRFNKCFLTSYFTLSDTILTVPHKLCRLDNARFLSQT